MGQMRRILSIHRLRLGTQYGAFWKNRYIRNRAIDPAHTIRTTGSAQLNWHFEVEELSSLIWNLIGRLITGTWTCAILSMKLRNH
ncbi:hypothetical protein KOR42_24800 [Thalassoglobus neptunius]|uniref:Uncharacterized protein n=1 Tax=Thalassoglobus neptunius TaxID=1938619 RepID=A0A5C5X9M3_9PLAN|nr:hypothetical protein KOR42_24800 [Thalassoglobus neptunius]